MTPSEFKSWFEGFTESMEEKPTQKQWERICKRVKEIDGFVTTYPIYVDRYVRPYYRWYNGINDPMRVYSSVASTSGSSGYDQTCSNQMDQAFSANSQNFNSQEALYVLGQADAKLDS